MTLQVVQVISAKPLSTGSWLHNHNLRVNPSNPSGNVSLVSLLMIQALSDAMVGCPILVSLLLQGNQFF